jgi:arylsulfatase A-like enzyme
MNGRPKGDAVPSDDDLRFMMESYDACIRHVDESLRELAGILDGLSRERDTVLVVTADHGDEFMEHRGLGHGHSMHQELLRVPLVAAGGALPQGVRVSSLARGIDVTATVADLAGLPEPATFEGRSLLPLVAAAERGEAEEPVPLEPHEARVRLDDDAFSFAWHFHLRGLTTEHLHLVADTHRRALRMYDVRSDPHGRQNLFRKLSRPSRRMRRKLEEYERRLNEAERRTATLARDGALAPEVAERSIEQLRALGYVE